MRKLKTILLTFLLVTIGFASVRLPAHAVSDVEIKNLKIDMVVDVNGKITVDETLDYLFNTQQHGAFIFLPEDYTGVNWTINGTNYVRDYHFPISNVKVIGDPVADMYRENGNVVLKIGDANVYVSGPKTYHFTYTMQMRDLDLNGYQSFYMNLVGQYWQDTIEHTDFSITLPSAWPQKIFFYAGDYGNNAPIDLKYTISGNKLTGSYDQSISYGQSLTIKADLPDGYFTFIPAADYSGFALLFAILVGALMVLAFFRFGRDEKPVETVEFNPIPGLSSAQVGFVFDGFVDTRDVLSLIIEWASKGYLSITEESKSAFTLTKLKPIADTEIRAEKTLFNALFLGRDEVTNKELENTFYLHIQHAQGDIQRHFQGTKERNIYRKDSTFIKFLLGLISMLPLYLVLASLVYHKTYQSGLAFFYPLFVVASGFFVTILFAIMVQKWRSLRIGPKIALMFPLIFLGLVFVGSIFGFFIWTGGALWMYVILMIVLVMDLILVSVMDKRTPLGTEYLGRILGLKHFIEVAEKDKLEMLVKDDPEYFYRILPYAYVLNVSDVWSKKFESIAIPQPSWYASSTPGYFNSFLFMNSMNHTLGTMNRAMTSAPRSRGGGGGFGGGGGGGFSGGGFGGGGGGHW
jgi:uncharacterized membrane protein YgcG